MNFQIASVDSIIIYFGDTISQKVSNEVLDSFKIIEESNLKNIIEVVPSYTSIYIQFDIFSYTHEELYTIIKDIVNTKDKKTNKKQNNKIVTIPVYYDISVAADLQRVATLNNLSIQEVIDIHSSSFYKVYTIGFSAGFGYLGEIDKRIKTPRLNSPRQKVPAKSVAIADTQTAVYPKQSPGGWNILGRTYIDMFDKKLKGFSYLSIGDSVKFEPIDKEQFISNGGII